MTPDAARPPLAVDLPKLEEPQRRWRAWLMHGITLALAIAIATSLSDADLGRFAAAALEPGFLVTLFALYFALPVADWIIFRRLWRLPLSGFPVLLRKRISNELLLAYSGELYFYLWARARATLTAAPFGAIKDVNIQSALAANLLTMVLLLIAYPFVTELHMGEYASAALWSAALILAVSIGLLAFRRKVFSLAPRVLAEIFAIHLVRLLATTALAALLWHLVMPAAPIGLWLALSALRLLVTRLPFVPNKEVLFASIAIFLLGHDDQTSGLIALTSASLVAMHLVVGVALFVSSLTFERER